MGPSYYGMPFLYRHYYTASTGIVMGMVHIKTDTSIEAMREAGRVVAQILTRAREVAAVGVTPANWTGRLARYWRRPGPPRRS